MLIWLTALDVLKCLIQLWITGLGVKNQLHPWTNLAMSQGVQCRQGFEVNLFVIFVCFCFVLIVV